ncbi:MAG: class I SAM-dependent methyltransferase [Phycisphaerae bacterium]
MNGSVEKHFLRRGHGVEFEMEADWVRRHLPTAARRVVDVGCGIGGLFGVIGPSRALGVDHCVEGLTLTRKRFQSTPLMCAAAERLPFTDGAFDAMTCQHVIEHISAYKQACREWLRALQPGGVLLLLTPNAQFRDPSVYADKTHVRIFDRHSLRSLLLEVGFDILDLRTIGLPWFRNYHRIPSGWRLRRFVTTHATVWSAFPLWRWKGQTLCCVARRPAS